MDGLTLDMNWLDYSILVIYFVVVLGIGFAARRGIKSSLDFFLSGRSLPAWVTGLAFIAANLGAVEILGQAGQRRASTASAIVHFYWIGAIPAMVFLGIVMMPFYYGSKVRSVPEYLRLRFDRKAHLFNAITFARGTRAHRRGQPLRAGDRDRGAARLAGLAGDRACPPPSCCRYITARRAVLARSTTRCCSSSSSSPAWCRWSSSDSRVNGGWDGLTTR